MRIAVLLATLITASIAGAESLDDWTTSALAIVQQFEGSSLVKVTPDSDGQGLSLGLLQWTLKSGSLKKIIDRVGRDRAETLARQVMPTSGNDFVELIRLVQSGRNEAARQVSLRFQDSRRGGNSRSQTSMQPKPLSEIRAWLSTAEVSRAQMEQVRLLASESLDAARAWKTEFNPRGKITFGEFMFFFDAATQGGQGGLADSVLGKATKNVRNWEDYTSSAGQRKKDLLAYYISWLQMDWPTAGHPGYLRDAKENAKILRESAAAIPIEAIHLLYMKYVRASVGNISYQLPFINRGIIDVLGRGYVNGTFYDFSPIYKARQAL